MWYILTHNRFVKVSFIFLSITLIALIFSISNIRKLSFGIQLVRSEIESREKLLSILGTQMEIYQSGGYEKYKKLLTVRPEQTEEQVLKIVNQFDSYKNKFELTDWSLKNITSTFAQAPSGISQFIAYQLDFQTTLTQYLRLLETLEKLPVYVEIIEIGVQKVPEIPILDKGKFSLTLKIFTK